MKPLFCVHTKLKVTTHLVPYGYGADTGFFIQLKNEHPVALTIWNQVINEISELIVSTMSINELLFHYYRRGKSNEENSQLPRLIEAISRGLFER